MVEVKDDWDYQIDNKLETKFDKKVSSLEFEILERFNEYKKQSCNYNNDGKSHEEELKLISDKNKTIRQEIETKLEELSRQKTLYQNFKSDQKLLSEEIKDRHEALLMIKKYYKKNLKIYYTIESRNKDTEIIFLQFFTEAKKDADNFSIRLQWTAKSETYELLETNPKLPSLDELKRMFKENDMPGALCHIRRAFLKIKKGKNT